MKRILIISAAAMMLAGCGTEPDERDLLAPQRDALERAEQVEGVLEQAAERQRRLIDNSGG